MNATAVELIHSEGGEGIATGDRQMKTDTLRCDNCQCPPWVWAGGAGWRRRQQQWIWWSHFWNAWGWTTTSQQLHINFTPTSRQLQQCDRCSSAHQAERINKAAGERRAVYLTGWNTKQLIDLGNGMVEEEEKERVGVQQNPLLKRHSSVGRLRNRQASG